MKIGKYACAPLLASLLAVTGCDAETAGGILAGGIAVWAIGGLILFVVVILAVLDLIKTPYPMPKKLLWGAIILVIPYLGAILYFLIGRHKSSSTL